MQQSEVNGFPAFDEFCSRHDAQQRSGMFRATGGLVLPEIEQFISSFMGGGAIDVIAIDLIVAEEKSAILDCGHDQASRM